MAVTNFTADAIGDYFFAKLQEPFTNVTRVTGYNILVGVNSPNSVGTLAVTQGSTQLVGTGVNYNLSPGNHVIVGSQVFEVASIDGNTINRQLIVFTIDCINRTIDVIAINSTNT